MSITYKVQSGDSFESIARRQYGTETEAARIEAANPNVDDLVAGVTLIIPAIDSAPKDSVGNAPSQDIDEIAVLINNTRFRFWQSVKLTKSIDSFDTLSITAPFEPGAPGFRDTFRPFSYQPINVFVGGSRLFSGVGIGVQPNLSESTRTVGLSAYSRPGVLGDCTPAPKTSLEYVNKDLLTIAKALCFPFGLDVVAHDSVGAAFKRVSCNVDQQVLSFLADLAKQRGVVISNDQDGALVFQQSVIVGAPVAQLSQGASPLLSVAPAFSPQQYYSSITGIGPTIEGISSGVRHIEANPRLSGVLRPYVYKIGDDEGANVKTATQAKLGRMFGDMAAYTVRVSTWRDPAGNLWRPNTLVSLEAPGAMIYSPYTFLIRSVALSRSDEGATADLQLVIPSAYAGQIPESLPWD